MLAETTAGKPWQRIYTEKHLKENFDYFDLLKTIAIYFVVVYHCSTTEIDFLHHASFSTYAYYFLNSVLSTCVPIFFFINGALLLNKPTLNLRRHTFKIIRMVLLVTLWAVITFAALMVIRGETLPVKEILKSVWQIKEGWTTHLWFLPALVVIYIFLPLLFTTYKHSTKSIYFFLAFVMLLTFGNTFVGMLLTAASFFSQRFLNRGFDVNYFGEFNPFRGIHGYTIGYFILGGLLFAKREILHLKKYRTLAWIILPLSMFMLFSYGVLASVRQNSILDLVWSGYDTIFTLINVVAIFVLVLPYRHRGVWGKVVTLVGKNSLGIYFIHIIIGSLLEPYYKPMAFSATLGMNVGYTMVILFSSLLAVWALRKIPVVRSLFIV